MHLLQSQHFKITTGYKGYVRPFRRNYDFSINIQAYISISDIYFYVYILICLHIIDLNLL
jgi:hypothetical protein